MDRKEEYILKLKSELGEISSEIEKLIIRIDKIGLATKQGYDEWESTFKAKQALTQTKLSELSISGDKAWALVWDNVWDGIKEFNGKASVEIKQVYQEVEPILQAKYSTLRAQLDEPTMTADEILNEVWNEIWDGFWSVVEEVDRKTVTELNLLGEELEALKDKQAGLQTRLHELLISGDEVWNVSKEITRSIVE